MTAPRAALAILAAGALAAAWTLYRTPAMGLLLSTAGFCG